MSSSYSVIIRVRNEESFIGHAIQSCLDYLDGPEIVVVDNCSSDQSSNIARMFQHDTSLRENTKKFCDLKLTQISNYTPGRALNMGARLATRENLLILSSHCVITEFDEIYSASLLEHNEAWFGNQTPFYYGKRLDKRYLWSHFKSEDCVNMFSELEDRFFFHNAFSGIRKNFLLSFPFSEDLAGKEDRYWINNIIKNGYSSYYASTLKCSHHYTANGNTWKGVG